MLSMTTNEAAEVLGVSGHEARRLARAGELLIVGRIGQNILLDAGSVQQHAARSQTRGRPWDQRTAWAAVDLLNGGRATWLSSAARSRLRAKLAGLSAEDCSALARRRARAQIFRASGSFLPDLRHALVASGVSDLHRTDVYFGLAVGGDQVEGYTDAAGVAELIAAFHLVADPVGNVTLHEVQFTAGLSAGSSAALTALDLSNSLDVRERSAGLRVLSELLVPVRRAR